MYVIGNVHFHIENCYCRSGFECESTRMEQIRRETCEFEYIRKENLNFIYLEKVEKMSRESNMTNDFYLDAIFGIAFSIVNNIFKFIF